MLFKVTLNYSYFNLHPSDEDDFFLQVSLLLTGKMSDIIFDRAGSTFGSQWRLLFGMSSIRIEVCVFPLKWKTTVFSSIYFVVIDCIRGVSAILPLESVAE